MKLNFKIGDQITNSVGIIEFIESVSTDEWHSMGRWKCFCGTMFVAANTRIKCCIIKSCGCIKLIYKQNKIKIENQKKERIQNKTWSSDNIYLYRLWAHIKNKCYNKNDSGFCFYGEKGIVICDIWKNNSKQFINDILLNLGHRPTIKHQLDRIDVRGNYELSNIRWATPKENSRNKSNNVLITINNETKTLAEWSELSGVTRNTISARYKRGCVEEKILKPIIKKINKPNNSYLSNIFYFIIRRCYDKESSSFINYGAKGISIYPQWKNDFKEFEKYILENLGNRPTDKHQLDRYPNKYGNYEPGNLRWATVKENGRNKTNNRLITINGIQKTLMEWSEVSGINKATISNRIKYNWPESEILSPIVKKKISDKDILIIREDVKNGAKMGVVAKKYGVWHAVITDIIHCRGAYEKK